jgi:hypothetical protein
MPLAHLRLESCKLKAWNFKDNIKTGCNFIYLNKKVRNKCSSSLVVIINIL